MLHSVTRREAPEEWERTVVCEDSSGRERAVRVSISDGRVSILPPPGAAFLLSPRGVSRLREALREAQLEVLRHGEMG